MTTVSLSSASPLVVTTTLTQTTPTTTPVNPVTQSANQGGDTAAISGHAMLLSRLFHTNDLQAQPPVMTTLTTKDLSGNSASFLRMGDRKLIERAYEYASANGMDPVQVDNLAFDLSLYRNTQTSGSTEETTQNYDMEGNPWVGKFNAHDAELAKRMLTSQAINDTDIDRGFLAYTLNPQKSHGHAVSFESLEKFISVLSPSGGKPSPADGKASQPVQPTDPGLAQALYRIDNPYVGEKWVPTKAQDSDDQPLKHLSKHEIKQLLNAYQMTLLYGTLDGLKSLNGMSKLVGLAKMQQDGSLNGAGSSSQAAIGRLLNPLAEPDGNTGKQGTVQDLLSIKKPHIDTSA